MNLLTLLMFGTGAILVYSSITGKNPIDVVKEGLGGIKAEAKYKTTGPQYSPSPGEVRPAAKKKPSKKDKPVPA